MYFFLISCVAGRPTRVRIILCGKCACACAYTQNATRDALGAMEVPTLSQLKLLLNKDHIFRDYFNTFLSLPVRNGTGVSFS